MTRKRTNPWVLVLTLAAVGLAVPDVLPADGGQPVAGLSGSGPVGLGAMLLCGYCIGAGATMLLTDSWPAFLANPSSWRAVLACGAACYAVVEA
jgi:hypothetical protein